MSRQLRRIAMVLCRCERWESRNRWNVTLVWCGTNEDICRTKVVISYRIFVHVRGYRSYRVNSHIDACPSSCGMEFGIANEYNGARARCDGQRLIVELCALAERSIQISIENAGRFFGFCFCFCFVYSLVISILWAVCRESFESIENLICKVFAVARNGKEIMAGSGFTRGRNAFGVSIFKYS